MNGGKNGPKSKVQNPKVEQRSLPKRLMLIYTSTAIPGQTVGSVLDFLTFLIRGGKPWGRFWF
jgi:hypothetical protein